MRFFFPAVNISILIVALFQMGCTSVNEKNRILGKVDGTIITEKQVRLKGSGDFDTLDLKMWQARAVEAREEHAILERNFERLVDDMLLDAEAERQKITRQDLEAKEVLQKVQEPTDEEIEAFYEANKNRISLTREAAIARIRDFLKHMQESRIKEEYIAGLSKTHTIVRYMKPLRFHVDSPDSPSKGPASAPVQLVEFSDFQCRYCKAFSATLKRILEHYGDQVRLVFRQYPLSSIHHDAERAAMASLCASEQDRFWDMHDLLFENQESLKEQEILDIAEMLGMDIKKFQSCLESGRYDDKIKDDIKAGAKVGVEGTPTLFINGRYFNGNLPYEEVASVIEEELENIKDKQ